MIQIDKQRCTGCGTCVADCVSGVLSIQDGKAQVAGDCFRCGHCIAVCPHAAVSISVYSDPCIEYDPQTF